MRDTNAHATPTIFVYVNVTFVYRMLPRCVVPFMKNHEAKKKEKRMEKNRRKIEMKMWISFSFLFKWVLCYDGDGDGVIRVGSVSTYV